MGPAAALDTLKAPSTVLTDSSDPPAISNGVRQDFILLLKDRLQLEPREQRRGDPFNNARSTLIFMVSVAKIVELIGTSDKGWEDAAQLAVREARKTIRGISGIEVVDMTAKVDDKTGRIVKYRTCVKISFGVDN